MTSFVLVPGAFHCSKHVDRLNQLLGGEKNQVIVVELPVPDGAQAEPAPHVFQLHVAAVLTAIDSVGQPVVLVGHCMSGRIIIAAAEQRNTSIQRLIFLCAETLPGPLSFLLEPSVAWSREGLLTFDSKFMRIVEDKEGRFGEIFFSDASDADRLAAIQLLQPSSIYEEDHISALSLDKYHQLTKAYIVCSEDKVILPVHQATMHDRLGEGALRFNLESGHSPFVSCPEKLAELVFEIVALPDSAFVLSQLCDVPWEETRDQPGDIEIQFLGRGKDTGNASVSDAPRPEAEGSPPAKRPHHPAPVARTQARAVAYRISKSRRDSTLVKVLKFPCGVAHGAKAEYWYDSFVDDPAQYTNARLNVPERGHEPPLDVAGATRSLCAIGVIVFHECSRVAISWERIATKVPGELWARDDNLSQVWGLDGREWNGSYKDSKTGQLCENLSKYTQGNVEAFWEDVPRKAVNCLAQEISLDASS